MQETIIILATLIFIATIFFTLTWLFNLIFPKEICDHKFTHTYTDEKGTVKKCYNCSQYLKV